MSININPLFSKVDPAHLLDGVFVPTNGKPRGKLSVVNRSFGGSMLSFQGPEQLGASDQSVFLALLARAGIERRVIYPETTDELQRELRSQIFSANPDGDDQSALAFIETSLYRLLKDSGYDSTGGKAITFIKSCIKRLCGTQIHETVNGETKIYNLIAVCEDKKKSNLHIAVNRRLTKMILYGPWVYVSLAERNLLKSEVAKLLHCWLSSNVRLGQSLGYGRGVLIKNLIRHLWGNAPYSSRTKSGRLSQLRDALDEIRDRTHCLHDGKGWLIPRSSTKASISRPKHLPDSGTDMDRLCA